MILKKKSQSVYLLRELKSKGARLTKLRKALIEILIQSDYPIAVPQMAKLLDDQGQAVNKTTIYRELGFLLEQSFIREIDLADGRKRYELSDSDTRHHHLVCIKCRSIKCISLTSGLEKIEQQLAKEKGFFVKYHLLEFFGLCAQCLRKGKTKKVERGE